MASRVVAHPVVQKASSTGPRRNASLSAYRCPSKSGRAKFGAVAPASSVAIRISAIDRCKYTADPRRRLANPGRLGAAAPAWDHPQGTMTHHTLGMVRVERALLRLRHRQELLARRGLVVNFLGVLRRLLDQLLL